MKNLTEAARAAKEIRTLLGNEFPSVKFSVRSRNFSMGDAVDISYENGPTYTQIESLVKKFQYGHFDGMIDLYEHSNVRSDIPQAKFVQIQRNISPDVREKVKKEIATKFGIENVEDEQEWQRVFRSWSDQVIWKEVSKLVL
jgi:hypothetical protein